MRSLTPSKQMISFLVMDNKIANEQNISVIAEFESRPSIWKYKLEGHSRKRREIEEVAKPFNVTGEYNNCDDHDDSSVSVLALVV